MAYNLNQLRSERKTSIHGRRLALDQNDYLVGPRGLRDVVEDLTTTAASSLLPHGCSRLMATGSTQLGDYTLQAPIIGVTKRITMNSSSTGCQLVRASGGALFYGASVSTVGSTVINFLKSMADVTLFAESSLRWRLLGAATSLVSSDSLGFSFTTST